MPERGWYSLTVRKETAEKIMEIAKNRDLTVDELINELVRPASKGFWSMCIVCGAKVARARKFPANESLNILMDFLRFLKICGYENLLVLLDEFEYAINVYSEQKLTRP